MTIKYYNDIPQGSDEWFALRCGLLTASEMKLIITSSTLKYAQNDKERAHLYELLAQRINNYVEPHYVSDDMMRGHEDEIRAKIAYSEHYAPVQDCGFITNDKWGFTLGYSPDGLIGDKGLIECKSRRQKFQVETIINASMPDDFRIQTQTGLLVSEREWCEYVTYNGGMPMLTLRIEPDEKIQKAIVDASTAFHEKLEKLLKEYKARIEDKQMRLIPTERVIEQEMYI